jgi:transposase-like protein
MRRPNRSWRVDETYVRVAGKWVYLYRAVDWDTIDFMLSPNRDLTAAKHDPQFAEKLEAIVGLYRVRPSMPWCCAWMRRARSKRWTVPNPACR